MKARFFLSAVLLLLLLAIGGGITLTMTMKSRTPSTQTSQEALLIKPLEVHHVELPNGLHLLVQPDHSTPVVSIQAWCHTGSMMEGKYEGCGISHFLEHMLFKGTEKRGNSEIAHTIQDLGGYLNAYTFFDRTVYYVELPSAGWKTALDVLTDTVFRSTLPQEEFEKEREVIRREFAMGQDDPERELQKLLFRTAFVVHPCRHPIIGHLDLFNQISHDDLAEYYKSRYTTDNITFIIAGDVDPEKAAYELTSLTSKIQRRPMPPLYVPSEPAQLTRREAHNPFPTDVTRLCMAWHIPPVTHPDIYALDILAAVAGQGQSSRLQQELVEKRSLLRNVNAFSFSLAQSGLWAIYATLQPGQSREEAQQAIFDSLHHLEVTPTELEKVKRQAIAARANELKTVTGRANSLGDGWFAAHDAHFGENYLNALQKVTLADLKRVAETYLTDNNLTLVSLNPQTQPTASALQSTAQAAPTIECRTLANGAKVVLTPDSKVPLVTIGLTGCGGLLSETADNNGISQLTSRLLDKGTQKRSAQQIAEEIENLGGNLESDSGNNSFSLSIEVLQNDAQKAVELLADMSLHATFPQEEVAKEKAKQLADLKIEVDQPTIIARNATRQAIFGKHPYAMNPLGSEKTLSSIKREDIAAYHHQLMNAGNVTFYVGGSFDPENIMRLLNEYFASLPKGEKPHQPESVVFPEKSISQTIATPKEQAIVQIAYPGIEMNDKYRPALEVLDEAFSDLGSPFFIRIREKQSLAYFVGSSQMIGLQRGYFVFYAGVAPQNSEKAKTEILDEIRIIVEKGLSPEEIRRAQAKLVGQRLLANQSAASIAYRAALNETYGLGVHFEEELIQKIQALTTEQINAAAKHYFSTPDFVLTTVQPVRP